MTSYAAIDTQGTLHLRTGELRAEFGKDGPTQVNLSASGLPAAGWVGDCSLITPGVPRNPVGAAVLCCLGAGIQPYAGTVVVTGFAVRSYEADVCDLDAYLVDYLPRLHWDVRVALGVEDGELTTYLPEAKAWAEQVREVAEIARTGGVPPIRIRKGEAVEQVDAADRDGVQAAIQRMFDGAR